MKNSLLILGIALMAFTNVCNAKNTNSISISSFQKDFFSNDNEGVSHTKKAVVAERSLNEDGEIFNPETVIVYNGKTIKETIAEGDKIIENAVPDDFEFMAYEQSMAEIIAEADLIIENAVLNETYPLFNERTMADEIAELEMIIESKETNETKSLDFKKINGNAKTVNSFYSNKFIGMK